jgi:hypothetical protein
MPWDSAFESMMNQAVQVRSFISRDGYGEATYGPPATYKCYIDASPHQAISAGGQEVTASATIYFAGPVAVTIDDVVILPNEGNRERPIISVGTLYDDRSPHHTEVHV